MASAGGIPTPDKDYLTILPLELLHMIADHLNLFKKLELRRVFPKTKSPIVHKLLESSIETLFVTPNRISMENFGHICRANFFRSRVKRVVFVPLTLGRFEEDDNSIETFDEYRRQNPELDRREAQESFNLYRESVEELQPYSAEISEIDDELRQEDEGISEDLSDALYNGLIRLPALKTVGIASDIDREGLNSNWYMLSNRLRSMESSKSAVLAATRSLQKVSKECEHVTTFLYALETLAPQLEAMFIGEGRGLSMLFDIQTQTLVNASRMQISMQGIQELTISCSDGYALEIYDDEPMWVTIAESAPRLQRLRLYAAEEYQPEEWRIQNGGAKVLNHFLNFGHYEKLKKFEVFGCSSGMSVISAKKLHSFLLRHGQSLEEVLLKEVLVAQFQMKGFAFPDGPDDSDMEEVDEKKVCTSLRALISTAAAVMPKLRSLLVEVKRSRQEWFDYQGIESLAEEFAVIEKNGAWRFKKSTAVQAL